MAGHGWHCTGTYEISRRKCKCGKGEVIEYKEEWESDWAGDKTEYHTKNTCPDNCEAPTEEDNKRMLEELKKLGDEMRKNNDI